MLDHWQRIDLSEFLNSDKVGFLGGGTGDVDADETRGRATCGRALICSRPLMSGRGLGCVKTPALAADVETFWRNCISESRRYCTPLGSMP